MRVRVTTTLLGLTSVTLLALPACSTTSAQPTHTAPSPSRSGTPVNGEQETSPLSSAALDERLLDEGDLRSGYVRTPERPAEHDDVTVIGCVALSELGGDAAIGGTLAFPHKATADFTYGASSSEISEELYSDRPDQLSDGVAQIFDAMTGCPAY